MTTKAKKTAAPKTAAPKTAAPKKSKAAKAAPDFVANGHSNGATFSIERPGVLATLYELMWRAEQAGAPLTKAEVLAHCVQAFAERPEANMKTTISAQLPGQFKLERGFILTRSLNAAGHVAFALDSKASEEYIIAQLAATGAAKFRRPLPWRPMTKEGKAQLSWRGKLTAVDAAE